LNYFIELFHVMRPLTYIKSNYNKPPLKTILIIITSLISLLLFYWLCVLLTCMYSSILPSLQTDCDKHNPAIFCGCSSDPETFYGTYFFAGIFSLGFTIIWLSVPMAILFGVYYGVYMIYILSYECYKRNKVVETIDDSNIILPV